MAGSRDPIVGRTSLDNQPVSWRARRSPAIPAPAASTSTSTNSCITMRPRLAPSAVRTVNSSRLVTVRAYTRIAIFAHGGTSRRAPSRKMTPASQRSRLTVGRMPAAYGTTRGSSCAAVPAAASCGKRPTVVTSACAPSSVAPGTRRAKTKTSVFPGRTSPTGLVRSGVQRRWFMGNRNPSGITPTTMCGVSPIWMRCPRTARSDENPDCQSS